MKTIHFLAAFGAFMLTAIAACAADLLQNGSFESPVLPPNTISTATPDSWYGNGSPFIRTLNGSYGGSEFPGPQDGQQYAAIGGGAAIAQAFTVSAAGTYELTWFDNAGYQPVPDPSPYTVTVNSGGGVVASTSLNASHFPNWVSHSMQLPLAAGSYTVVFQSTGPAFGLATLVDSVSLPTSANNAPVADDQSATTFQDTPIDIVLTASDLDGDSLTYAVVTQPAHGALTGTAPNLSYKPDPCFSGQDSFTFKANDGQADSDIATVNVNVDACQLSGPGLMAQHPGSDDINDLVETFQSNVRTFLGALVAATDAKGNSNPADVSVNETLRSPARAYLMHYAYEIARRGLDPAAVPQPDKVSPAVVGLGCIRWLHVDADCNPEPYPWPASVAAAEEMLKVAAPHGIAKEPAYPSNHQYGTAIDMTITWRGTLVLFDGNADLVTIKTGARNGANNAQLWAVGASYGVIKLQSDRPHWSLDGH